MKSTKIRQFTQTNQEFTKTSLNMDAMINYRVEFSQQTLKQTNKQTNNSNKGNFNQQISGFQPTK
jgi:flagellar biosynthesis chaperone FliJ